MSTCLDNYLLNVQDLASIIRIPFRGVQDTNVCARQSGSTAFDGSPIVFSDMIVITGSFLSLFLEMFKLLKTFLLRLETYESDNVVLKLISKKAISFDVF